MTKYTFREVIESLPAEKRRADGTVTKLFHRPLSFPLSWIFLKAGWSANQVTWLSIGVSLCAFICTLIPLLSWHIAGIILYIIFGTLDCVDGNMARVIKKKNTTIPEINTINPGNSSYIGEWADALGGYVTYACILLSLGLSSLLVSGSTLPGLDNFFGKPINFPYGDAIWPIIASVACASNLLMRLAFQSWRAASGETSRSSVGNEKRFSEETGITGWFQPFYLVGLITGTVPWVLIVYTAIYAGGCAYSITKLVIRITHNGR